MLLKTLFDIKASRSRHWISLMKKEENIILPFIKQLRNYFNKMKQEVLNNIQVAYKLIAFEKVLEPEFLFNMAKYDELLKNISRKYLTSAYQLGIDSFYNDETKSLQEADDSYNINSPRAVQSLEEQAEEITIINETMQKQLLGEFEFVLATGLILTLPYEQIAHELAMASRNKFGFALMRTETISRTEINGTVNMAKHDTMKEVNVKYEQWLTARVGVRESHVMMEGQITAIDQPFITGDGYELKYPCDPAGPASEVCNCRCQIYPYTEA